MVEEASSRKLVVAGGVNGLLAVALGAFGAHALKTRLSIEMLTVYQTGVQYHLAHALAILLMASLSDRFSVARSGWLFVAGIVLFSGSLYALALTGIKILGAITPLGGICFLSGWALLVLSAWKRSERVG